MAFYNRIALIISLSIFLSALSGTAHKSSTATLPPETATAAEAPTIFPFSYSSFFPDLSPTPAEDEADSEVADSNSGDSETYVTIPVADLGDLPPAEDGSKPQGSSEIPKEEQFKDEKFLESHMKSTVHKLEKFISTVVDERLKDPNTDERDKQCLQQCQEVYESAVEAMQKSLEDVNTGDFFMANLDVSAFTTNIDTCDECFDQMIEPEFQKFDNWARGVASDCLDKIVKYSNTS